MNEDITSARWLRIKALFAAAVEAPGSERSELLTREAQGDSALIAEVQSLLAAHDEPGEFLDNPPAELKAQAFEVRDDAGRVGERIGAYRIVGVLGAGGMGHVFKAVRDDDQYRAEVASSSCAPTSATRWPSSASRQSVRFSPGSITATLRTCSMAGRRLVACRTS